MTRVIKIGGRAQTDPALAEALVEAVTRDRIVVVHGGGDEVSTLQRRLGMTPRFHGGRRVTTPDDLDVVRMVLSGTANKRLVAMLVTAGIRAVGLSGEDDGLLRARATARETLGEVGEPSCVDQHLLRVLCDAGFVPVVSPLARDDATGATLNVNGDDAAAAIAVALGADELALIADVPGVMAGGEVVPELDVDQATALIDNGTARDGMAAKLEAARRAVERGVARVRIGDVSSIRSATAGTVVILSPTAV
ncbi:MAG TPA: acetylglutamate kinase [Gemmatimonadaceae bacterium]|jgi:acetylglutamate kinase|nr:acetylglutamate kinase [Gemmatimonadaceae bacterium]